MSIDEHKSDIWRGIHGLAIDSLVNAAAQARFASEQLQAANAKLTAENAALKAPKPAEAKP